MHPPAFPLPQTHYVHTVAPPPPRHGWALRGSGGKWGRWNVRSYRSKVCLLQLRNPWSSLLSPSLEKENACPPKGLSGETREGVPPMNPHPTPRLRELPEGWGEGLRSVTSQDHQPPSRVPRGGGEGHRSAGGGGSSTGKGAHGARMGGCLGRGSCRASQVGWVPAEQPRGGHFSRHRRGWTAGGSVSRQEDLGRLSVEGDCFLGGREAESQERRLALWRPKETQSSVMQWSRGGRPSLGGTPRSPGCGSRPRGWRRGCRGTRGPGRARWWRAWDRAGRPARRRCAAGAGTAARRCPRRRRR